MNKENKELFQNKCSQCKKESILHIHHIVPYRLGGSDCINNLIPLCPVCHSKQTVKDWEHGHHIAWKIKGAHTFKEVMQNGRKVWN